MTDTQADLTERARAVVDDWLWLHDGATGQDATRNLIRDVAAFAQSEREAAAAEARRAAIEIANAVRCRAADNEGALTGKAFASMSELTRVSGFLAGQRHAAAEIENAIRALASPPAPQEETR